MRELAEARDGLMAAPLGDLLTDVSAQLVDASDALDRPLAAEALNVADVLSSLAAVYDAVSIARAGADLDDATAATIDHFVETSTPMLRNFANADELSWLAPALVETCEIRNGVSFAESIVFMSAASDFLETEVGRRPAFGFLREMVEGMLETEERARSGPSSTFVEEHRRCRGDRTAHEYGDSAACDTLHDACAGGDLLACNDLYWISGVGTAYEAFAASCGERVEFNDPAFAGFCEELDE
jgi:hypothetical protein